MGEVIGLNPKGSAWFLYHRDWSKKGESFDGVVNWAFVFDYAAGLTAHEAWQKSKLQGNPPYYEVVTVQLQPFSSASASTRLSAKAQLALEAFQARIRR